MLGDEHKSMNKSEKHARAAIISSTISEQSAVSHDL